MSTTSQTKRPVARHACLACREKKVKCDGEIPSQPGEKTPQITHKRCTNCNLLGIECIFVRSQRGGKRRKDVSKNRDPTLPLHFETPETASSITTSSSTIGPNRLSTPNSPPTSQYDPRRNSAFGSIRDFELPMNLLSSASSPYYNNGGLSPLLGPSSERDKQSVHSNQALHEKVRRLQKEAADIQSQLDSPSTANDATTIGGSSSSDSTYDQSEYYRLPPPNNANQSSKRENRSHSRHHDHSRGGPRYHHWPPPPPPPPPGPHHHWPPPPPPGPHHHWPPPPPLPPFGRQFHDEAHDESDEHPPFPPPPPFLDHHHRHGHDWPPPPPPPGGPFPHHKPHHHHHHRHPPHEGKPKKRGYSPSPEAAIVPKLSRPTNYIKISNEELELFDLPDWNTTCTLIDLYYRYIHPARPFLPPKHRLVYQIQIRQDASLLHAIFASSCRFASSLDITNPKLRDSQHWYFLAEKYWDLLDLDSSLQALVLLMGSLGPGGYVQQSIEGSERFFRIASINNVIEPLMLKDWNEFASVATKKQVVRYEDMLRTIWGSWKLNVFTRVNRGFPYDRISDKLVHFNPDLPFPTSDSQFNLNMSLFDSNDVNNISKLKYRTWRDVEHLLEKAVNDKSIYKEFVDSEQIIIAIKLLEDIMDVISEGTLTDSVIEEFNIKIDLVYSITNSNLYQISHIKKKMAIINISKIFALFVLAVAKLVINVTRCSPILFIKPHQTKSNENPDNVFNSLYQSKYEDIEDACLNLEPQVLNNYITTFVTSLEAVRLLDLGLGIIPEVHNSSVPATVIGGPLNFAPACEISSLKSHDNWWTDAIHEPGKSMSAQAQTYNTSPDVWLQYPIFSIVVIANALTILASSLILTKIVTIREVGDNFDQPGYKNVEFSIKSGQRVIPMVLEASTFYALKDNFKIFELQEKIGLCSKYIQAQGRFWPYVESISNQAEAIINYVDDIISRT